MAQRQARNLRLVIAAAGYGKTTALRRLYPEPAARWLRGDELATLAAGGLGELGVDGLAALAAGAGQLVLDGLPALSAPAERGLLDAVAHLPAGLDVALSSRWPVATSGWLASLAPAQIRPVDLVLTVDSVEALLRSDYGLTGPDLAGRVWEATAGWPALVRLVAEALLLEGVPAGPLLPAITEPGGLVADYVAGEVLGPLPVRVRCFLRQVSDVAPVTAGLCRAIGAAWAGREVAALVRIGILTRIGLPPDGGPGVVPVVAAVAGHHEPPASTSILLRAAAWHRDHGSPRSAAFAFRRAGDLDQLAGVLTDHGDRLVVTGRPDDIADLVAAIPAPQRTRRLRLLAGDALRIAGEVTAAAHYYHEVAGTAARWDAGIAWRIGLIHYLRGDQRAALAAFARADEPPEAAAAADETPDRALLLAWTAAATARAGDATAGVEYGWSAYRLAVEAGHDGALATAHTSLALCLGLCGDQVGSGEHYQLARRIAEQTGDLVLLARILVNQSYHLVEQARFPAALEAAEGAAAAAEAAGHANLYAIATSNEAEILALLGRYDEGARRYTQVLSRHGRLGSRRSAAVHCGLGELYRLRGWREQARASFGDALRLADESGSQELTVKALAGLALTLLPDDPVAAARHAADAADRATDDDVRIPALLAQGWVAIAAGDGARAVERAGEAIELARPRGRRAGLAAALELRAAAETDPDRVRDALREARAIWLESGAVIRAAQVAVAMSRLPGADADTRFAGLVAVELLAAENIPLDAGPAGGGETAPVSVLLKALGRFEVCVAGRPVPPTAWQSRRARDLLRILVSRRGRPVPRSELCEWLWPDDDPTKTGHRLSVLLSIVRGVLDPDRAYPSDHYLVSDAASVALDVTHVRLDVAEFLGAVAYGQRLLDRGADAEARTVLTAAVRDYAGDVFDDEPYADWAGPLREQARAAHIAALRLLADSHRADGGIDAAVDCLLRLLEKDPYDEPAHRTLVRLLVGGGRHGEARRAFARYRDAMVAIAVRVPDESILEPRRLLVRQAAGQ